MKNLTLLLTLSVMALSCKKNQPIPFVDSFDCAPCESSYCVPIEQGDTNTIEVALTEITENLITNGDFASGTGWTVGSSWAISGGEADYVAAGGTTADKTLSRSVDSTMTAGYYMVKVDITYCEIGGFLSPFLIKLGGTTMATAGAVIAVDSYYFYKYITPSSNLIEVIGAGEDISIDNIEVYKLSSAQYTIQDCTTEEVFYTNDDNTGIEYASLTGFVRGRIGAEGYATVTLNWTTIDLPDGCYCICFKDAGLLGYEFIENGTFASSANWDIVNTGATGWSITAGVARHSNIAPPGDDVISQTLVTPLDATMCYNLTFDIISAGSSDVTITYDTATASDLPLVAIVGSGNFTQTVPISGKAITVINFAASTYQFDMDNVSIEADPECVLCETSNCISLREDWDAFATARKMCNILVTATNANKAFGFSAGYDFSGRIFGVIRNASYPDIDNTEYKDFTGLKSLQYNDNEKVQELQVAEIPQGVHDWLRLALRSQTLTLTIGTETKTFIKKAGDYQPNWRKSSPNAPVIVEIQEAQQVPSNARNVS